MKIWISPKGEVVIPVRSYYRKGGDYSWWPVRLDGGSPIWEIAFPSRIMAIRQLIEDGYSEGVIERG